MRESENPLEGYLRHLTATGRRPSTVTQYRRILSRAVTRLGDDPASASPETVAAYADMRRSEVSETTAHTELVILGEYMRWLGNDAASRTDLLWNRSEPERRFLTPEQFRSMLDIASTLEEKVVLLLGGMMGLRRAEIAGIEVADIYKDCIVVHGKGHGIGKTVRQPMPAVVAEAVRAVIARLPPGSRYLLPFPAIDGTPVSRARAAQIVSEIARDLAVAVGADATTHSLRRLYCTVLYRNGTDLDTLRRLMRHNSISTTMQCYLQQDDERMRSASDGLTEALGL